MSLAILFRFLCAQNISDINISITRSLRLFRSITTLVVLFLVRSVLEFRCGWVGVGWSVAGWLKCCAGSIPTGVSGFFIDIKSFRSYYGPGVDSASHRNEYQEYFLGVKADGV